MNNDELRQLATLRDLKDALDDPDVRLLALKARGLSSPSLTHLHGIIDHVRSLESDKKDRANPDQQ